MQSAMAATVVGSQQDDIVLLSLYLKSYFDSWQDEAGESRMRVAGYCEKVLTHQDKRASTYTSYNELLAKLKSTKDVNTFLVSISKLCVVSHLIQLSVCLLSAFKKLNFKRVLRNCSLVNLSLPDFSEECEP